MCCSAQSRKDAKEHQEEETACSFHGDSLRLRVFALPKAHPRSSQTGLTCRLLLTDQAGLLCRFRSACRF